MSKLKVEKICPQNRDTMRFFDCSCISCQNKKAEYVVKIGGHTMQLCCFCAIDLNMALNDEVTVI